MTPTAIISLIRDIVVVAAVGLLAYMLISFGENRVEKKDLQALEQRIKDNADTEKRWRDQSDKANGTRDAALAQLHADLTAPHTPVIVRVPVREAVPLPANSTAASSTSANGPGAGNGCGSAGTQTIDIRPDLNALELKYGTALIECRAALDKWPR